MRNICARVAHTVTQYNALVRAEADQARWPVFAMDGDFERRMTDVLAALGE